MDDTLAMGVRQGFGELFADPHGVGIAQLALHDRQGLALHELPDQEAALAVAEEVVERHDAGVREAGRCLDLAHHASRHAGAVGDHLERYRPLELAVVRFVHLGEATGAHLLHYLVALRPVYVQGSTAVGHDRHGSFEGRLPDYSVWYNPNPVRARGASGGIGRHARFRV